MNPIRAILPQRPRDVDFPRKPLFLAALVSLAAACSLGAEENPEQPLVLEFEHCGHFELVVHVGEDFHFVDVNEERRMVVKGRIVSLEGDTCRLKFSIDYCELTESGAAFGVHQHDLTLRVGEPPRGAHGSIPGICMTSGPWIRRGLDPVPSLKAALARGGKSYYAAAARLQTLGPRGAGAVPILINVLRGKLEIPPEAIIGSAEEVAARTLGEIGPAAKQAVPTLLAMQEVEEPTRVEVAVALWKIDRNQTAIPKLIVLLRHGERDTRRAVLRALGDEIGAAASQSAPAIKELLDSDDAWLRQDAARALWRVVRDPDAIDVHVNSLKNSDDDIRSYAAWRLGRIGPPAREAVPALVQALLMEKQRADLFTGGDQASRDNIIEALSLIDPSAQQVLPLLTAVVRDDPDAAGAAGKVLGGMGPGILPKMQTLMASDDSGLQDMGTLAMYYAGSDSVPFLEEMLDHPNPEAGKAAAFCLRDLGAHATAAIPSLIKCLTDDQPKVPIDAGAALVEMGEKSVGPLRQLLDHEDQRVRRIAKRLLQEIHLLEERDVSSERSVDCLPD